MLSESKPCTYMFYDKKLILMSIVSTIIQFLDNTSVCYCYYYHTILLLASTVINWLRPQLTFSCHVISITAYSLIFLTFQSNERCFFPICLLFLLTISHGLTISLF